MTNDSTAMRADSGDGEGSPADSIKSEEAFNNVSLFPVPAAPRRDLLQAAIAKAQVAMEAKAAAKVLYREHLDNVVFHDERSERDTIARDVDDLMGAANSSAVAAELDAAVQRIRMERADMMRKVTEALGRNALKLVNENELETAISTIVRENASLSEAVRLICAAAGTVRVDEYAVATSASGVTSLQRRFVDVGDEEPGQDPLVETKWLLTAALKASVRFKNLLTESQRVNEALHIAQASLTELQGMHFETVSKLARMQSHYQALLREDAERGDEAPFAPTRILVTDGTLYMRLRPGKDPRLSWAYGITRDPRKALAFDDIEQARAILHKVCLARLRNIPGSQLAGLRVVRNVTEDHGFGDAASIIYSYPPMLPAVAKVAATISPVHVDDVRLKRDGVVSYDVSVREDAPKPLSKKERRLKRLARAAKAAKATPTRPPVVLTPERKASLVAALMAKRAKTK